MLSDSEKITPPDFDVNGFLIQSRPKSRPEHSPIGDPCAECGILAKWHRTRARESRGIERIIGADGEGYGRDPHRYYYLAAVDEDGESWEVENPNGLKTEDCLELFLGLPRATVVTYSNQYDLTKILEALPDKLIHLLFHPERRRRILAAGRAVYSSVKWGAYWLNWMNGRFSVGRLVNGKRTRESVVIWDIWRFFQCRFTKALVDWFIATEKELEEMSAMKALRDQFDRVDFERVKRYCRDECNKLAKLFRALIVAHTEAGLKLQSFYGAGSTSTALLKKMGIKEKLVSTPEDMKHAVACAFFGGRFEDSIIGPVHEVIHDSDISSAYPYHATLLPCLLHGKWSHYNDVNDEAIRGATLALVHWELPYSEPVGVWAPWPVRGKQKTVVYPWSAPGGWVWRREYLLGKELCPHAKAKEAWLYETPCSCKPFGELPEYYRERIRVGKASGRGKVFKLGPNGVYGKLAQTTGHNPPFQSFILSGNITSETRADLLAAILKCEHPSDILTLATDGIKSLVALTLPQPVDTGTFDCDFPLGGWERKTEGGRFFVRPGISLPLYSLPGKRTSGVKSRGYGKKTLEDHTTDILEAWEHGFNWVSIYDGERFGSAISELSLSSKGYTRGDMFGDWYHSHKIMKFNPAPKRRLIPGSNRLGLITHWTEESFPYAKAL